MLLNEWELLLVMYLTLMLTLQLVSAEGMGSLWQCTFAICGTECIDLIVD